MLCIRQRFLNIKNVEKFKQKNVKKRKKRDLNKNAKKRVLHIWLKQCITHCTRVNRHTSHPSKSSQSLLLSEISSAAFNSVLFCRSVHSLMRRPHSPWSPPWSPRGSRRVGPLHKAGIIATPSWQAANQGWRISVPRSRPTYSYSPSITTHKIGN